MDTEAQSHPTTSAAPARTWPMFRAVVGIGVLCGLAIVVVYEVTRPVIRRNRMDALEQAIIEVLPGAASSQAFRPTADGAFEPAPTGSDENLVYAAYDTENSFIGVAMVAEGMGYQDVIRLLYGYSLAKEAVVGIRVLESRETPGLGDRVETDPDFLRNFKHLDVRLGPDGTAPAHPIEFVKPGEKQNDWQIDGISGATITSQAIADMLRRHCDEWVTRVHPRREDFQHPKESN